MSKSIDNIGRISILEYIVMFFAISLSGNPLLTHSGSKLIYVASAAAMFGLCLMKGKKLSNSKFIFWLAASCILFILQNTILELTSVMADFNFLARLYIAFLTAMFFGHKFREVYFRVMLFVCAISIPLFILQLGGFSFGYEISRYKSLLVYNFTQGYRNPGMFWEPGAFQGFIMLVPLFYSDKLKQLWNTHKKGCIIMLIALLTTKSTTAYLTLAAFIFLTILLNGKINPILKGVAIAAIIGAFTYAWSQDFMGEKIMNEYEEAQTIEAGEVSWSRMGAMMVDINNIERHPIIGNGFLMESRYGILGEYMTGSGNGLTGAINIFGIPFILLYLIGIFTNLSHLSKANRLIFIFSITMILFGEYMLNYVFFWSLLFIKFPINEKSSNSFNCIQP